MSRRALTALIAGVAALVAAALTVGIWIGSTKDAPSSPTYGAVWHLEDGLHSAPPGKQVITYAVTGDHRTADLNHPDTGGNPTQTYETPLPWTHTVTLDSGEAVPALWAQNRFDAPADATIRCIITVNGRVVADQSTVGSSSTAVCVAPSPQR